MDQYHATAYAKAEPLGSSSCEMATAHIKVIVASRGSFFIAGRERTAFVVGSRAAPIEVAYAEEASCTEFVLPAWAGTAVLGVSGRDLGHSVQDVGDLNTTPFLSAITQSDPDALDIAKLAYKNWSVGRGAADARIAQRVWHALHAEPTRRIDAIAKSLGLTDRRVRGAVRQETGLSAAQWRKLIRLEKSSDAITRGAAPLATIAYTAGYADQSHMNRDYVELAGTSPALLRRSASASVLFKIDPLD